VSEAIAVVGSRGFEDYPLLKRVMDSQHEHSPFSVVVSGGAKGADSLAARWAREKGLQVNIILPLWDKHGKAAGMIRNQEIVDASERMVAFWDGESRGTADSIKKAVKARKVVLIVPVGYFIKEG
jgi:NAD(P)H-hydrate repair Nnr-like enzyme with NAD(P)H-hydrate epimerase domain